MASNNPLKIQLSDGQLARYDEGIGRTNVTFEAVKRDMNTLFPAPEAFQRCQLAGHCSARGCLGKANLRVRQKLKNSQPWSTHLSVHVVLDSSLKHGSLPRSFCLLRGSSTSICLPSTLMKRHETTEISSFWDKMTEECVSRVALRRH